MARRSTQKYTAQQKRDAIELANEIGTSLAAVRLGIPKGSLSCWRFKDQAARKTGGAWPPFPAPAEEVDEVEQTPLPAVMARRIAKIYTPSQRAVALELVAKIGVNAASRQLGISRFSLYEWRRKVEGAAQGKGDSPTSGPDPKDVEAKRDAEILAVWHEHPGLGPSQVRNQLRRKGIKVSTHTVRRVMEDAGYRPPKVVQREHTERFEAVRPNHLWHLDFVQRWIGRASTFTLILIDDHSRFVVGHGVDDAERSDLVLDTFEQAVARYGGPEMLMHDKGSAFWSWKGISRFTRLLEEMGTEQIVAEAKEWNGKIETFRSRCTPLCVLHCCRRGGFQSFDCFFIEVEPGGSAVSTTVCNKQAAASYPACHGVPGHAETLRDAACRVEPICTLVGQRLSDRSGSGPHNSKPLANA